MKKTTIIYIIIQIFLLVSCVEPFEPDIKKYEELLVVDGLITNEEGPYEVKLSRTYGYDDNEKIDEKMVEDAKVKIIDDLGNESEWLTEMDKGVYQTDSSEPFKGKVGRDYKIYIETISGGRYESDFETLNRSPEIKKIDWKYEKREDENIEGVQLFLNTSDKRNETWFYRWEYVETWEFVAPFYDPDKYVPSRCWKTSRSKSIIIHTTSNLTQDIVNNYKLYYISNQSNRLLRRYSSLVKQYAMSERLFNYWKNLESTNVTTGSLFDPIPSSLQGNIKNLDKPNKPALGYFQVCGVSTKRIFIDRDELPESMYIESGNSFCQTATIPDTNSYLYEERGWIKLGTFYSPIPQTDMEILMASFINDWGCIDCSLKGDPEKPEFWKEK